MSLEAWGDENPDDADAGFWMDRALDEGWIDPGDYSPGAFAIMRERDRQEVVECWTAKHDDVHAKGELAAAAACYILWGAGLLGPNDPGAQHHDGYPNVPGWPWDRAWWKPKDRRTDLVRAGALIAAEIDRLDRISIKVRGKP